MTNGTPEDHDSLVAAHHARVQALLDGNLDALSKVVGKDLLFISAFGQTMVWPDVVKSIQSGSLKMLRMDSADIKTQIYGDVGLLTYKADTVSEHDGEKVETSTLSVTVYVKRDGGWQMVSQQHSPLS